MIEKKQDIIILIALGILSILYWGFLLKIGLDNKYDRNTRTENHRTIYTDYTAIIITTSTEEISSIIYNEIMLVD